MEIQDTPETPDNEQFIQIGKTPSNGERVALLYFNMTKAIEDLGLTTDIAVTDSRINFRVYPEESDEEFNPGYPVIYPLKTTYDENTTWEEPWTLGDGPVAGVDYYDVISAKFKKMKKTPETAEWIQGITTLIARYFFTETTYRKSNNGFVFKFETTDGKDPTHVLSFDSPGYVDSEFYPFMDICFLPVEPPIKCEDGTLVRYEFNADTFLTKDGLIHGLEEYTFVGNSGWDGPARTLLDFDISEIPDTLNITSDTESVYLRMWYEGAEMGKPYNDPRQLDRTLAAHKVLRSWSEASATSKYRSKSNGNGSPWASTMMKDSTDYESEVVDSYEIQEGSEVGDVYLNLTTLFTDWMADRSSDYGVLIKDNVHESVPGYFLKFASLNHEDPTKRPYLLVCQEKQTCEPVDSAPEVIYNSEDGCVSKANVTLNACVAKNGGCKMETTILDYADEGFHAGVTALWSDRHELVTFCKCCMDVTSEVMDIPMDCSASTKSPGKEDYTLQKIEYITSCECHACEQVKKTRTKRSVPSRTRLLLRSALKSMLKK